MKTFLVGIVVVLAATAYLADDGFVWWYFDLETVNVTLKSFVGMKPSVNDPGPMATDEIIYALSDPINYYLCIVAIPLGFAWFATQLSMWLYGSRRLLIGPPIAGDSWRRLGTGAMVGVLTIALGSLFIGLGDDYAHEVLWLALAALLSSGCVVGFVMKRVPTGVCQDCGHDLRGLAVGSWRCPECGGDFLAGAIV